MITSNGHAVAELTPVIKMNGSGLDQILEEMRGLRENLRNRGVRLGDLLKDGQGLRELAHEGHRY